MRGRPAPDLTGFKSGWLEVLERAGTANNGNASWRCKCHGCGREDVRVEASLLRRGQKSSCGCKRYAYKETPPFPKAIPRTVAQEKRAATVTEAQSIVLEMPAPGERCEHVADRSKVAEVRCPNPPLRAGARYCATHAVYERNAATKKPEKLALTCAEPLRLECARCGASEEDIPAGESAAWFRQHRVKCPALSEEERREIARQQITALEEQITALEEQSALAAAT